MKRWLIFCSVLAVALAPNAFGHFPMLIHDAPFAEVNQVVNLMFAFIHPYEQEYVSASPKPEKIVAIEPSGKITELTENVVEGAYTVDNLTAKVWSLPYKVQQSGDVIIAVDSPEIRIRNLLFRAYVKVFVHAEEQDGWRQRTGQPLEIVPLTRPYGLEEGFVFTGRLMKRDEPVAGAEIQIEQFLTQVPAAEDLPPEPLITKVVVTDPNGIFSHTLPNPGWWICAYVEDLGEVTRDGRTYTPRTVAGIWIHVEEKFIQKFPTRVGKPPSR